MWVITVGRDAVASGTPPTFLLLWQQRVIDPLALGVLLFKRITAVKGVLCTAGNVRGSGNKRQIVGCHVIEWGK